MAHSVPASLTILSLLLSCPQALLAAGPPTSSLVLRSPDVARLVRLLRDGTAEQRVQASRELRKSKPGIEAAIPSLLAALGAENGGPDYLARSFLIDIGRPAYPGLVGVLNEGTPVARWMALVALEEIHRRLLGEEGAAWERWFRPRYARDIRPVLLKVMAGADRVTREDALNMLARMRDTSALPGLIAIARSAKEPVELRQAAVQALGLYGGEAAVVLPVLLSLVRDSREPPDETGKRPLRGVALFALGEMGSPAAKALAGLLSETRGEHLEETLRFVRDLELAQKRPLFPALLPLGRHPSSGIRGTLLWAMKGAESLPEARMSWRVGLCDPSDEVRLTALHLLRTSGAATGPSLLVATDLVRRAPDGAWGFAAGFLRDLKKDAAPAADILKKGLAIPSRFSTTVACLQDIIPPGQFAQSVLPLVVAALRAADPDTGDGDTEFFLRVVGRMGPLGNGAVPALLPLLRSKSVESQVLCIRALGAVGLGDKQAEKALRDLQLHASPRVRSEARQALERWRHGK